MTTDQDPAFTRFLRWAVDGEGSTRSSGLLRIGLAAVLWSRWANEVLLFRDLSPAALAVSIGFYVTTTAMLIGWQSRWSTAAAGLVALYMTYWVGLEGGREPWTHHHTFLLAHATFLCALTPCGGSYSLDRWLVVRKAERRNEAPPPERAPTWGLRLVAIQCAIVYAFGAYDKLYDGFTSGARMQHYFGAFYTGAVRPTAWWFEPGCSIMAMSTVVLEFALAIGLFFPKGRKWLVIPGLLLHAFFYATFDVATFSATMFVLYLAFFDPDAVHDLLDRLQGRTPPAPPAS